MTKSITPDYLLQHGSPNLDHFTEVGVLVSNAVMADALREVTQNGSQQSVELTYKVRVEPNTANKCVQVTWTRADGSTLTYHRPK
ncbi:hypothetical protein EU803_04165 [Loktanella sp. IMCC34160]|uniref:hypothetical protein n=1 Tax=Loktanella sp. IMCC34160 TaxID=2510646 RepID=UPI00101DFA86|nr:hypothetical protein [Loktanella sp. IMCC34160]RYG93300.1 hypothetical protein EU803_04165 [Loktanella sp. IMCC34160]